MLRAVAQVEPLTVGGEAPALAGVTHVAQLLESLRIVDVGGVVLPRELVDAIPHAGDPLAEFVLGEPCEHLGATCREVEPLEHRSAVLTGALPQAAVVEIESLRVARREVRVARLDDVGVMHGLDGSLCGLRRRCRTAAGATCCQRQQQKR